MQSSTSQASEVRDWLPRLPGAFYRGFASVHWQMTLDRRATGWLKPEFHPRFREILLHAMARYDLLCPAYCLMPDHLHLLWMGVSEGSDQLKAVRFFRWQVRTLLGEILPGARFQKQAYDHVLRSSEKGPDEVREVAWYILQNPVRAGLVQRPEEWPELGAMLPGYPTLHPLGTGYWKKFWNLRAARVEEARSSCRLGPAVTA